MDHLHRFSRTLILPGLAMIASLQVLPAMADDTAGTTLAAALNMQWKSSAENCTHGSDVVSALTCSGVLLKQLPDTPAEQQMEAGGLLFLRHDLNPSSHLTGAVMPAGSALNSNEKAPSAACARPIAVATHTVWSGYGCGAASDMPSKHDDSDASTCSQQSKGPGEAGWKWDASCSLSVEIHQEFSQAMALNRDSITANPGHSAMQVWYHYWPATLAAAKPQALVYTSGDDAALKDRQNDRARLKKAGQEVPVLKYTAGSASPFSYTPADNVVPAQPDRNSVQKKLNELFAGRKGVSIVAVPPSVTKDNHTMLYPVVSKEGKAIISTSPYEENHLVYNDKAYMTKDAPAFQNFGSAQIVYGFIVDKNAYPLASIYAPSGSAEGRAKAVALAKWYNGKTHSTLPVAMMNASSGEPVRIYAPYAGENAFAVQLIGNEPEIQPGPEGSNTLEEKAQKVIARFSDTRESCPGNTPAWHCSGLIMRATAPDFPFTQSPEVVRSRGVASYFYLRADTHTKNPYNNNQGILLKVPDSASVNSQGGQKVLSLLKDRLKCIYPHDADTGGNHGVVSDYQCHKSNTRPSSPTDLSDCSTELRLPANAGTEEWKNAWHMHNYTLSNNQCAFSIQHASQFNAATELTAEHTGSYTWNELILSPSSNENDIPELDAVWYQYNDSGALDKAKDIARQYLTLRRVTLPLIGWDYNKSILVFEPTRQIEY